MRLVSGRVDLDVNCVIGHIYYKILHPPECLNKRFQIASPFILCDQLVVSDLAIAALVLNVLISLCDVLEFY